MLVGRPGRAPRAVLVVDDHPAVRAALERLLAAEAGLDPVASAATVSGAVADAHRLRPDIAVVDYRLPDRDGISLTFELKRLPHPPGVVMYSAFAGVRLALAAIVGGADAIVDKSAGVKELRAAVRAVASGERVMPSLPAPALSAVVAQLDTDDEPIVAMLLDGSTPREVASELEIAADWLEHRRWAIVRQLLAFGQRSSR